MIKRNPKARRLLIALMAIVLVITLMLAVYWGSIPEKYSLQAGDASPYDIFATRSIRNKTETDLRALNAAASIQDVMLRSEQITTNVKADVATFFNVVTAAREDTPQPTPSEAPDVTPVATDMTQIAEQIVLELNNQLGLIMSQSDALIYATVEDDRYSSIRGHVVSISNLIMAETVDTAGLMTQISERMEDLESTLTYYQEDSGIIRRTLELLLKPNVVFDEVATENARQAAYDKVQNNPIMIEKGSRLVTSGDIITDEIYLLLLDLDLIDTGEFDYSYFAGIALLILILLAGISFYLRHYEKETIRTVSDFAALSLALIIPLLVSVYTAREAPLSPPVYFTAVLITSYFGFRAAIIMSLALTTAILPMTNFDPTFMVVALFGCLIAAIFTRGIIRKDNYAYIIIMTAGTNFLMTVAYGLMEKQSWADISLDCGIAALSGALAVIAAIGIMPLFEMLFNSVSPMRLIELSQPGHPLLRRLFVEAPGSSQHSMMVANLADAAAVAIGANALLARVGAYYHDIGKLENPIMFTENQEGENPHDYMSPEQSAEMILGHPDAGVRIGRRYRLPGPILKIINEHHGSTEHAYFYHKAMKGAEDGQRQSPDPEDFKYACPVPSSRESAIVMLADTIEAAMRSTGTNNLDDAEKLIRRLIKGKNDQDQLINSDLSFHDVELIIQAFLQVYTGHFHERVKYPDDRSVRQPTA